MGVSAGPRIETDGLVFALDAKNTKTFGDIPGITDHGISDWYCFISGQALYSAIYPNTEIIEIDSDGNEVGIVTTGSDPEQGSFSITSGKRYYATKAVHMLDGNQHHRIAPVSYAGTYLGSIHTRNDPQTIRIYAPQDDINVSVYENVTGGVTGTASSTFSVSKGSDASYVTTEGNNVYTLIKTDKPAVMTATSSGGIDNHIMQPMSQYSYRRRYDSGRPGRTINNTAPSNLTSNTYILYDTSLPVFSQEVADGAGSASTQGIGYEYLSDTFSWGQVLSDYHITAPYADTTVTVSYWANGQWNVGEVHSLSGTQTSPAAVDRDGTNGFGVDGSTISGSAANLASGATLWKWESTKPIAVIINDNSDDEGILLGWMSNNHLRTSSNSAQSFVNLIDKGRRRMKMRGKRLTTSSSYADAKLSAGDSITFDGSDDEVICDIGSVLVKDFTIGFWLKSDASIEGRGVIEYGGSTYAIIAAYRLKTNSAQFYFGTTGAVNALTLTSVNLADNNWHYVVQSYDGTNARVYVDGNLELDDSSTFSGNLRTTSDNILRMGRWVASTLYQDMELASVKVYNKALTASEIKQNFNALRGRFGI